MPTVSVYEFSETYNARGGSQKNNSEYFIQYKEYLLSRLRSRLTQEFDEELGVFEADLKKKAIDLIMNVQMEILGEFQKTSHQPQGLLERPGQPTVPDADHGNPGLRTTQPEGSISLSVEDLRFSVDDIRGLEFFDPEVLPEDAENWWMSNLAVPEEGGSGENE